MNIRIHFNFEEKFEIAREVGGRRAARHKNDFDVIDTESKQKWPPLATHLLCGRTKLLI